ncbi:outer membrane protein [Bradyrhizobium oligotrophicum S58]
MRRFLLANLAALAATLAGPAVAADMPLKAETPFAARFNWTGCYLGGHLGGGFARKDITDPVQLVQDSFGGAGFTPGVTSVNPGPAGAVIGGQIGCDYQFAPSWVAGVEGAASGSTMERSTNVALPLGNPDTALVRAKTDFLASLTARIGYAFDDVLLYARGGAAMASDRYDVSGSFVGTPFGFTGLENRFGWTAGAASTGRSRSIGLSASNTTTTNSDIARWRCPTRPMHFSAAWMSGRASRSSRRG